MKLLWTTRELADALGVSRKAVLAFVKRHPQAFRPPSFGRRNGHPRKHRVFDSEEAAMILQSFGAKDRP